MPAPVAELRHMLPVAPAVVGPGVDGDTGPLGKLPPAPVAVAVADFRIAHEVEVHAVDMELLHQLDHHVVLKLAVAVVGWIEPARGPAIAAPLLLAPGLLDAEHKAALIDVLLLALLVVAKNLPVGLPRMDLNAVAAGGLDAGGQLVALRHLWNILARVGGARGAAHQGEDRVEVGGFQLGHHLLPVRAIGGEAVPCAPHLVRTGWEGRRRGALRELTGLPGQRQGLRVLLRGQRGAGIGGMAESLVRQCGSARIARHGLTQHVEALILRRRRRTGEHALDDPLPGSGHIVPDRC